MISLDKYRKKLKSYIAESICLKVVCYLGILISVFFTYISTHKNIETIENNSLTLVGISITVFSLNLATYTTILKGWQTEIKDFENDDIIDKEILDLYFQCLQKKNKILLYIINLNMLIIVISIIIIMISSSNLLSNAFGFMTLFGTITLMASLIRNVYYINKSGLSIRLKDGFAVGQKK